MVARVMQEWVAVVMETGLFPAADIAGKSRTQTIIVLSF